MKFFFNSSRRVSLTAFGIVIGIIIWATFVSPVSAQSPRAPSGLRLNTASRDCTKERLLLDGTFSENANCDAGALRLGDLNAWTLRLVDLWGVGIPGVRYAEQTGDQTLSVTVDSRGYPSVHIRNGDQTLEARSAKPLGDSQAIKSFVIEDFTPQGQAGNFKRVTIHTGAHNFSLGDIVWVEGLGLPYDGEHFIIHHTATELQYVLNNPGAAITARGARRLPGYYPGLEGWSWMGLPHTTLSRKLPSQWNGTHWTVAGWVRKHGSQLDGQPELGLFSAAAPFGDAGPESPSLSISGGTGTTEYRVQLGTGSTLSLGSAPLNQWVHLAVVREGGMATVYYNGRESGRLALAGANPHVFKHLSFGYGQGRNSQAPCDLDKWSFWLGRALAPADVAVLYGSGSGVKFEQLSPALRENISAWYEFDEPTGAVADLTSGKSTLQEIGLLPWVDGVQSLAYIPPAGSAKVTGSSLVNGSQGAVSTQRLVLTVTRSPAGDVKFYRDGALLSTAALVAKTGLRDDWWSFPVDGVQGESIESVSAVADELSPNEVDEYSFLREVFAHRQHGVAPLAVHFDATSIGVPTGYRHLRADFEYQWEFAGSDATPLSTTGLSYNTPTGFYVSHVFPEPGTYSVYLSVRTPPYGLDGKPQRQEVLHSGLIGKVQVDPWPASGKTFYVASVDPRASDTNDGLSPEKPFKTLERANAEEKRPFTRILLARGHEFRTPGASPWDLRQLTGPFELGAYGDPALPKPKLHFNNDDEGAWRFIGIQSSRDLRFRDIELENLGFSPGTGNSDILYYNLDLDRIGCFYGQNMSGSRYTTMDKLTFEESGGGCGGYAFWLTPAENISLTRITVNSFGGLHMLRSAPNLYEQLAGIHAKALQLSYGECLAPRDTARFAVHTDNYCAGRTGMAQQPNGQPEVGSLHVLNERNNFWNMNNYTNASTLRYLTIQDGINLFDEMNAWHNWGLPDFIRLYRSRMAGALWMGPETAPLKDQLEQFPNSSELNGSTIPLTAPRVALLRVLHGTAELGIESGASGGQGAHSYQWQRSTDGGKSWSDIHGARAASLADRSLAKGTYLYRMRVSDGRETPAVAISSTVTAVIQ